MKKISALLILLLLCLGSYAKEYYIDNVTQPNSYYEYLLITKDGDLVESTTESFVSIRQTINLCLHCGYTIEIDGKEYTDIQDINDVLKKCKKIKIY